MYSDMSSRIIAASSSNRNSASALVSSVLPTPVGPRNMNEPIGRCGSCSPARARRTAVETARALVFAAALRVGKLDTDLVQVGLQFLRFRKLVFFRFPTTGQRR